jgi:hypothetical protein
VCVSVCLSMCQCKPSGTQGAVHRWQCHSQPTAGQCTGGSVQVAELTKGQCTGVSQVSESAKC